MKSVLIIGLGNFGAMVAKQRVRSSGVGSR